MRTTKQSVKRNKMQFTIRLIISYLKNGKESEAISVVNQAGITQEQFGLIVRIAEEATDKDIKTIVDYISLHQLSLGK